MFFSFIPQNSNLLCHELENQVHETHGVCVSHIFTHMKFKTFFRSAVNSLASLLTKFFIFASSLISDIHNVWIKTNEDIFLLKKSMNITMTDRRRKKIFTFWLDTTRSLRAVKAFSNSPFISLKKYKATVFAIQIYISKRLVGKSWGNGMKIQ
jgi:hypothetical protein